MAIRDESASRKRTQPPTRSRAKRPGSGWAAGRPCTALHLHCKRRARRLGARRSARGEVYKRRGSSTPPPHRREAGTQSDRASPSRAKQGPPTHPLPAPLPLCLSTARARRAAWLRGREARARRGDSPAATCRFGYERGHPRGAHRKRPLPTPRTTRHGRPPHLRLLPLAAYTWRPRPLVNL